MYLIVNIIGILVYLGIAFLFSKDRKNINWKSIIIVLAINLILAWVLTSFSGGRDAVKAAADGFNWLVQVSYQGIGFALASWVNVKQMDFVTSSLLPILMIVPLFDILTYIGGITMDHQVGWSWLVIHHWSTKVRIILCC